MKCQDWKIFIIFPQEDRPAGHLKIFHCRVGRRRYPRVLPPPGQPQNISLQSRQAEGSPGTTPARAPILIRNRYKYVKYVFIH